MAMGLLEKSKDHLLNAQKDVEYIKIKIEVLTLVVLATEAFECQYLLNFDDFSKIGHFRKSPIFSSKKIGASSR